MHTIAKNSFHHQSVATSISKLITTTPLPQDNWFAFPETSEISTNARIFIECHWMACTGNHLAENYHLTYLRCKPWIYIYFVTFWVQWPGVIILGHFTLKIAELHVHCNSPLHCYPQPTPMYVLVVLIKNNLKWWKIQLAVDCVVGSLIAIK